MPLNRETTYLDRLEHLHRNSHPKRGGAPHKPILLLAILRELDEGRITDNLIPISKELVASFRLYWEALVPDGAGWQERMAYPFRYLRKDGFWDLIKDGNPVPPESDRDYTLNQLAALCDGGRFTEDLWEMLKEANERDVIRRRLLAVYFHSASVTIPQRATADYFYAQAEKLKQQASARFRVRRVQEKTDGYFVRNRLFPTVVKELYGFSCCVCSLSASMNEGGSLIDGAHILPFAEYHNDDPRNGLALCKNHHWGFDAGAWSLTDEYQILVSAKLRSEAGYVRSAQQIALPTERAFWPDPEALKWHRTAFGF